MPLFDQSTDILAAPENVSEAIKNTVTANQKIVTFKENSLVIVQDADYGYVYLLHSPDGRSTSVRLLVETKTLVRQVFQQKSVRGAILTLINTPEATLPTDEITHQQLIMVKDCSEKMPPPAQSAAPKPAIVRPQTNSVPVNPPWNPDRLLALFVLITTIGSGIVFGINWRRLGKPQWMWPTIAGAIALPILITTVFLATINSPTMLTIAFLGSCVNLGFLYSVWYLQRGAYKQWENTGDCSDYPYNIVKAAGSGALIAVGLLAAIIIFTNRT